MIYCNDIEEFSKVCACLYKEGVSFVAYTYNGFKIELKGY